MKDKDKIVAQISDLLENMPDKWVQFLIEAIELIKSLMEEYSDVEVETDKPNDDQAQADRDEAFRIYLEMIDYNDEISFNDIIKSNIRFNTWLEIRHLNDLNRIIDKREVDRIDAHYMRE